MRRTKSKSRWIDWSWAVIALLPGAGPSNWKEIVRKGDSVEYHATTLSLELWPSDTEAYLMELSSRIPSAYVVFSMDDTAGKEDIEFNLMTVSPYEAQDYLDGGEARVERVAMPQMLEDIVTDFCRHLHTDEEFIKRKRDRIRIDLRQDGIGDARIRQLSDVYRSPRSRRGG